ncbi:achaete-scute homolog 4-like [Lepisosteus oculatus]|uniref:achaete-scute homolog 4-like n=1 Tax=Lepisosteus oculatus TaxID=7918 RepID=UPI0037230BFB
MDQFGAALGLPFRFGPSCLDLVGGDPGCPTCASYGPFRAHLGLCDPNPPPAFVRKRNERERQRVRGVNEGYARLRRHLPPGVADGRLSKAETLRAAIGYIRHLQRLLRPPPAEPPERADRTSDGESGASRGDGGEVSN